jgi:hypothetical protein
VQELEARIAELEEAMSSGSCLGGNGSGDPGGSDAAVAVREPDDAAGGSSGGGGGSGEADGDDAALSADLWRLLESNRKMAGQMRAYSQARGQAGVWVARDCRRGGAQRLAGGELQTLAVQRRQTTNPDCSSVPWRPGP